MNMKKVIIILLVIIILAGAGFFTWKFIFSGPCLDKQEGTLRNLCYKQTAASTKDLSLCNKISMGVEKSSCYAGVAIAKDEPLLCNQIKGYDQVFCWEEVAEGLANPLVCGKIDPLADDGSDCYYAVAKKLKEPNVCAQIASETIKWACYQEIARLTGDASLCDNAGAFKTSCLSKVNQ